MIMIMMQGTADAGQRVPWMGVLCRKDARDLCAAPHQHRKKPPGACLQYKYNDNNNKLMMIVIIMIIKAIIIVID